MLEGFEGFCQGLRFEVIFPWIDYDGWMLGCDTSRILSGFRVSGPEDLRQGSGFELLYVGRSWRLSCRVTRVSVKGFGVWGGRVKRVGPGG